MSINLDSLSDAELVTYYQRMHRPWLRVNFVSSLDGAVAVDGLSAGLSGAADKRVFRLLRMLCDGLLVGAGTLRDEHYRPLRLDPARRAWRVEHGLPEYPRLVVASGSLHLDPAAPALVDAPIRPLILTHRDGPADTRAALTRAALAPVADIVECTNLTDGLALLRTQRLSQLLCEGGPHLLGSLTAEDLVDELCLTLSPLLAGPGAGRITAGPPQPARSMALQHTLVADDGSLFLRYHRL